MERLLIIRNSFFVLLFFLNIKVFSQSDTLFPVPDNLKENVEFWTIIYTKTGVTEGLIHDRDYPLIIYDKIKIGKLWGRSLDHFLDYEKERIGTAIKNVRQNDSSEWMDLEWKIAELYGRLPAKALDSAEYRIRFQQGLKEKYIKGLEHSGALIDSMRTIFSEYGIPPKLAFLPHVESSFDPKAFSKAGAAGIWQFMPETGKRYLTINKIFDERKDPILSTIAAARLLSANYKLLKSWPLTVTSYNYGINGILRAVEKIGTRDIGLIIEKHDSPIFRFASKNFYSCFIAAAQIAENPQEYLGEIHFQPPNRIREITLLSQMAPLEICRMLEIPQERFIELNPSIRESVYKNRRTIPGGYKIRIDQSLSPEYLQAKVAHYFNMGKQAPSPSGDSSSKSKPTYLAGNSRNVPPSDSTKEMSYSEKKGYDSLTADSVVRKVISDSEYENFDADAYDLEAQIMDKVKTARITVIPGETIGHYSKWLGIPVREIMVVNGMRRPVVHAGKKILLPVNENNFSGFKEARINFHKEQERQFFSRHKVADIKIHVVRYGENIWNICNGKTQLPFWLVKKCNKEINFNNLPPGTKIRIPVVLDNLT